MADKLNLGDSGKSPAVSYVVGEPPKVGGVSAPKMFTRYVTDASEIPAGGDTSGSAAQASVAAMGGGPGISPMQGLASKMAQPQTKTASSKSELYTVNPGTDTVKGQLENNYTDFNNKLYQRVGHHGAAKARARGLTNSSVATQGAMGAVLDKAGEWATTDAKLYSDRKTETLRSKTAIESSHIGADAQIRSAEIGADSAMSVAQLNNDAAQIRLETDIGSKEGIAAAQRKSDVFRQSQEIKMKERIATMSDATQIQMKEIETAFLNTKLDRETTAGIYADTANGIANIDPNASAKSQDEAAQRILDFHRIRMEALATYEATLADV